MRLPRGIILFLIGSSILASGKLLFEGKSAYSHIKVKDHGELRSLYFVRDSGQEVVETTINIEKPEKLEMPYISFMLASLLFHDDPESSLIIGLGGGAMVHYMNHHLPDLAIDGVEIDPVVIKMARKYFFMKENKRNRFFVEDGFKFLYRTTRTYDIIFMDAYLKPSEGTDSQGMPLHHKTREFLKYLQSRVSNDGLVVINMNLHSKLKEDLNLIRQEFAQVYLFQEPTLGNLVIVGSKDAHRVKKKELKKRAYELDEKLNMTFSFSHIVRNQKDFSSF